MTVTSINIQPELEEPLEALAQKMGTSTNHIINQAIRDYISAQALAEKRWQETLPALESMRAGRSVPAEKVFEWMQSLGIVWRR